MVRLKIISLYIYKELRFRILGLMSRVPLSRGWKPSAQSPGVVLVFEADFHL